MPSRRCPRAERTFSLPCGCAAYAYAAAVFQNHPQVIDCSGSPFLFSSFLSGSSIHCCFEKRAACRRCFFFLLNLCIEHNHYLERAGATKKGGHCVQPSPEQTLRWNNEGPLVERPPRKNIIIPVGCSHTFFSRHVCVPFVWVPNLTRPRAAVPSTRREAGLLPSLFPFPSHRER